MMEFKAPDAGFMPPYTPTIFLAGTIEQGSAAVWQSKFAEKFADFDVAFYNPRRDSWDSTWKQDLTSPCFVEQVEWELNRIMRSDVVLFNILPDTKSPITLLELGLVAMNSHAGKKQPAIVVCPDGYWRRGNVQIVCRKFHIPMYDSLAMAETVLKAELTAGRIGTFHPPAQR